MMMHDREQVYRQLWDLRDRNNFVMYSQLELQEKVNIPYQRLSQMFSEFTELGRMRKYRHRFQLSDPDSFEWGEAYEKLRKDYVRRLKEAKRIRRSSSP